MSRLRKFIIALTIAILVLPTLFVSFAAPAVVPVTTIVGSGGESSRYPFGLAAGAEFSGFPNFVAGGTYQQFYGSSAFSGPVTITQIAFSSQPGSTSGPGTLTSNVNISLSTTTVAQGSISTDFAANRGADHTQVFSGLHTATITANNQFDLVFDIAPFTYDPADGNLLVEVNFNAAPQFSGGDFLFFNANSTSLVSRAANATGAPGAAFAGVGFGLQTRFIGNDTATAQVTLGNLVQTFDGNPKSVSVTTDPAGLDVTVTYNGSATAPTNTGNYPVSAIVNDANFTGQANGTLVIQPANQLISFDALADKAIGDPDFNVSATASSNLPVSFSASDNCTIAGTQVNLTGAGTCTITATQGGNSNYSAAPPVARTFSIGKLNQQISFDALPNKTFGDADFGVSATASSGLAVSFSADDNCTITGTQVHLTGAGSCTITASQDGNAEYNPAAPVARTFTIGKADQQISFDVLANKSVSDADFNVSASASSNLTVSFSASDNCTVTGTQVHLTGAGSCTITASQDGNADYNPAAPVARTFTIGKADQQISFDALSNKTFGDADFIVNATASSNLAVSFSASENCTVTGTQVHLTGAGSCTITASQDGDANYNAAAPVARTFAIGKADQQITFDALSNQSVGDADFNVSATSSSNLAVSFSASDNCTISGTQVHLTGAGPCTITAAQAGNADYNPAAPVARTFTIGKADQQITFDALPDKSFGAADFNVNATASSNLAVSYSASDNCTVTGTQVHLTGVGLCTITAAQDGNADYNPAAPVAHTFAIGKADQQITFAALPDKQFGDVDFNLSATASSNLLVSFSATDNCTITGTQVHLTGVGPCTITAAQDGNDNYNPAAPVARTFTIGKADQQITFEALPNKAVGDADFNVTATASSNLAVSFSAAGNCTVTGALVHLTGIGSCTVTASQEGNSNYNPAAPVARTFTIGKADQQISFDVLSNKSFGDADFNVSATASSNLSVSFAASGNCTIAGTLVHLNGAGSCTVTASQDGDANYNAAAPVARPFAIGKADQQISFESLPNKSLNDADFNVGATASSGLAASFSAGGNCTITGTLVHLTAVGPCAITASQGGDANYNPASQVTQVFTIGKADQQITFAALTDKQFGDADFNVSATASSNLAVSFAAGGNCTIAGTQVHLNGGGFCTITASQDGDANYNEATPVARTFAISKADQQISFGALANRTVSDADFNVSATASSNLAVSFSASGNCTITSTQVHLTGVGPCTITASQDGDANYNPAAQVVQTFAIGKADQQISFDALPNKAAGDADFNVNANASSNLPVSFSANGNCTIAGTQVHITGAGSCTITASQDGNSNYNAATPVARTFGIGKVDQQISFEALLNKTVGDAEFNVSATASSNLAVSFSASGSCTIAGSQVHITGAGSCTITASQEGDSNYNAATPVSRTFGIGKVDQQITFDALSNKTVGDVDFSIMATASSKLPVSFSASGNCTMAGTPVHLTGAGSCTITASQDGDANYNPATPVARTFAIGKADQQISFDALSNKTVGDTDFNVSATASSNLLVSFSANASCTMAGTQVHITGPGSCTITASQEGDSNYNPATPVARTFGIGKLDQQITFDALSNKTVGDADFNIGATVSSNLPVGFSASGNCTIAGTQVHLSGAGSCTITASQDGNSNYNAATPVARSFAIGKANQQISFPALPDRTVGDADFNVNATASSGLPVSFSASGNCAIVGNQVHITNAGSCTVTASQGGDSNYNSAPDVAQTFGITQVVVNGAPDAVDDSLTSMAEDSGVRTIAVASLLANDTSGPGDESGQTLTLSLVGSSEVGGTVTTDGTNVYFTPAANFNGPASFQYRVTDNGTTNGAPDPKSDTASVSFNITEVNDEPVANGETLAPALEDVGTITIPFVALIGNDSRGPANESGQTLVVKTVGNAVGGTVSIVGGDVKFTTAAGFNGTASFDYTVEDNGTSNGAVDPRTSATATVQFNIIALADTPLVTSATTDAHTQTTSGLVISRNPADGSEVTHFRITGITGGSLFMNDGATPINDGDFITLAEGNAGLKFTPGTANGSFLVQSSTSAAETGLQGGMATATITVNHAVPVIRFSSNVYSVNEGAGFRTITVERTGDTSQPVTVDYVSSDHSTAAAFLPCTSPGDGVASSRCDFITAIGTLRFGAGETSKTFTLLVTQDNYQEGAEMVDLTLFNPTAGAELGIPATAAVEITDDVTEEATNPVDTSADFVTAQYHDMLNREPDGPGLAFWTDNIEKCNDPARRPAGQTAALCLDKQRESTAIAFFMSPEFQMTGGFVYRLYKGSLAGFPNYDGSAGRFPTTREFMRDVSQVSEGIVVNNQISGAAVEANRNRLAEEFVQRQEFLAKYDRFDNTLYVQELFNTTSVNATDAEKQLLVDGLNNGTETRASVLRKVVDGTVVISEGNVQFTTPYGQAFYQQEQPRVFVFMEYVGYLRRNPDAAGFNFWLGKLNHYHGDPFQAEMVRAFILSPEYRSRFGQP